MRCSSIAPAFLFALSVNGLHLRPRQSDSNGTAKVTIPQNDAFPDRRKQEVAYRHDNFLYNISLIGKAAAFPMGKLGEERVARAWDQWQHDRGTITVAIEKDLAAVKKALAAVTLHFSPELYITLMQEK